MLTSKSKTKKSKHGKKNWRKNIDISDIEISQRKLNQQKTQSQYIKNLKNEDLFEIDEPTSSKKPITFLNKKTKRPRPSSKIEQRKIKHIIETSKTKSFQNNTINQKKTSNEIFDLWGDSENKTSSKNKNFSYPKVPLPHPGQSYNPNKKDLSKLLNTVVENNKYLVKSDDNEKNVEILEFDDEKSEEITKPVANNEPVSDLNRLTRKEKRKKEIKKANKLMNKYQEEQKRLKVAINNALGAKKIAKEQKKAEEKLKEEKKKEKQNQKIKNYEIKKGIIKDNELLEDFQVNKNQVPLRKMKEEMNPLSERWNNIIKRKMLGEYSNKVRKKVNNRKLKKMKYMDILGDDYFMEGKEIDIVE